MVPKTSLKALFRMELIMREKNFLVFQALIAM